MPSPKHVPILSFPYIFLVYGLNYSHQLLQAKFKIFKEMKNHFIAAIAVAATTLFTTVSTNSFAQQHKGMSSQSDSVMYTCPMHKDVMSHTLGKCPKCGMTLVKVAGKKAEKTMGKDSQHPQSNSKNNKKDMQMQGMKM